MRKIIHRLVGGLTEHDMRDIHAGVVKTLSEIGIGCDHDRTLDTVEAHLGVDIRDRRIFFNKSVIEEFVERARVENPGEEQRDDVTVSGPWNCMNIIDMESGRIRHSTANDVRRMYKLLHAAGAGKICPVYPNDIHPTLQMLYLEKAGIEIAGANTTQLEFSDPALEEFAIRMHRAAGWKYSAHIQFPISPLRVNPLALDAIWRHLGNDDVIVQAEAAPIPQAGLTAPLSIPAALIQAAAEAIGAYIIARIIGGDRIQTHPQFRLDIADMRSATTVYASPEHILFQLLIADVYEYYYDRPKPGHFLQCNAKRVDAQAIAERTAYMLTLALKGFRRFCLGAGQLSADEVFSPALFIIDREIARFITHIVNGVPYEGGVDHAVETIAEGVAQGEFMTHESTLKLMRGIHSSELFPHMGLERWRSLGEPEIEKLALEKAHALIESHDYRLPDAVQAEIDSIYSEAEAYVKGH